jgi:polysaccharide biosynthesis protein PslG
MLQWICRCTPVAPLAILAAILMAGASRAGAAEYRIDRFVDPGSFGGGLGVNVHFGGGHRQEVEKIAAFGFRVVRTDLMWARVETERGKYDWRNSDALVKDLRENRLTPLLILDYSNPLYAPRVVGRPATDSMAYAAPQSGASRAAYMAFVRAAVRRYGDRIIWEVWNEPDHNFGMPVDLHSYIDFAQEACRQIRNVIPDATVIGPTASGFLWWFLEAFVEADRGGCFDAVSVHPYRDEPPESVLRDWHRARALLPACKAGSRCLGLVNSEWGYSVTGGAWTAQRQAAFVVRLRLLDVMAGIPLSIIYDWKNDGPNPADKEANFGLLDFHGNPKPVFGALQAMIRELHGLRYMGRIVTSRQDDFLLAFGATGSVRKLVGWTSDVRDRQVVLAGLACMSPGAERIETRSAEACEAGEVAVRLPKSLRLSVAPSVTPLEMIRGSRENPQPKSKN